MKKLAFLLFALTVLSSHDMYLKMGSYFLQPNQAAKIHLYNGTFDLSENVITRDRMQDVSLAGNGNRMAVDTTQWSEKDGVTILDFQTGEAGTWVAGVSTRPRSIELSAEDFNNYLAHDGVTDMLKWREENNAMEEDAVEKYSKHVKTIFQVGDQLTDDWKTKLGYPIEFLPLSNPYDLHPGHPLEVQLLWQGEPLANQLVYVGSKGADHDHGHSHDHSEADHSHENGQAHTHEHEAEEHNHQEGLTQLRTDEAGIIKVDISRKGEWYLRTIYLKTVDEPGLTHESNWATLTFAIGEGHHHHDDAAHHHDHAEEDSLGIPSYAYWLVSLLLIGGLFFFFNRKSS